MIGPPYANPAPPWGRGRIAMPPHYRNGKFPGDCVLVIRYNRNPGMPQRRGHACMPPGASELFKGLLQSGFFGKSEYFSPAGAELKNLLWRKPVFKKYDLPPCASPAPQGAGAHRVPQNYLQGNFPLFCCTGNTPLSQPGRLIGGRSPWSVRIHEMTSPPPSKNLTFLPQRILARTTSVPVSRWDYTWATTRRR